MRKKKMTFEEAIARLEEIAQQLSSQEATLDGAVELYAEAAELVKLCTKQLSQAELKIQTLSQTLCEGKEGEDIETNNNPGREEENGGV